MTPQAQRILSILEIRQRAHMGGIKGRDLLALVQSALGNDESDMRGLRKCIAALRLTGYPIAAHPQKGYYLASTAEDLLVGMNYLRARALGSLKQINRQRRSLVELAGQLRLGLTPQAAELQQALILQRELLMVSQLAEIPETLHDMCQHFLDFHPDWDLNRLHTASLSLFLMQDGKQPAAARTYLEATLGKGGSNGC